MTIQLCFLVGVILIATTSSGPCTYDEECNGAWFCNHNNVCDYCDDSGCATDSKGPSSSGRGDSYDHGSSSRGGSSRGSSSGRGSGSGRGSSSGGRGSSSSGRGSGRESDSNDDSGCCMGSGMCSNSMNMNNCNNMDGCHWEEGYDCDSHADVVISSSNRGSSSRGGSSGGRSSSRGSSSDGRKDSSSGRGSSRSKDDSGCCMGPCASMGQWSKSNCNQMTDCHWSTGQDCMMENSYAEVMMFSGESAVSEAMNTQVNLSTVVLLAVAALALHLLNRWWANRKQFRGYVSTNSTQPREQASSYQSVNTV